MAYDAFPRRELVLLTSHLVRLVLLIERPYALATVRHLVPALITVGIAAA